MNEYIINSPQLQSLHKRISDMIVWAICWLMWIYLLIPLITLSSWLLGDNTLSNEMRWFGGYKSLLELLEIYVATLLTLAALWLFWVVYHALRQHPVIPAATHPVTDRDLCDFYKVSNDALQQCRQAQLTTVYFDDNGQIIHLEPDISSHSAKERQKSIYGKAKKGVDIRSKQYYLRDVELERARLKKGTLHNK
ncbi:MAG: poly-beta-1,6-N-acetyl-D-glucosamine biosynthesis protein PgaD [Methylococcaceae bacterium]|nr:poly-beta-1,6-N-acetyl-D-glucosamine biosynthesis protein PgaD [Methylococcaceae bacterium]